MNADLSVLRHPVSGGRLRHVGERLVGEDGLEVPIVDGIPRFVPPDNYSESFGFQWNRFRRTQLDSYTGVPITETRLRRCLWGEADRLEGRLVLEAGAGAGRFTEVLLKLGAIVHAFDYSAAVEANALNNGSQDRLTLVQADIRQIPFPEGEYDYVVCLGVLQHTPDPEESLRSLWRMVKPGGALIIDHYRPSRLRWPPPLGPAEPAYRRWILRSTVRRRFALVKRVVDFWFPFHWWCRDWPLAQGLLTRVSPVHFYYPSLDLKHRQVFYEWALLDTHDSTTDVYKHRRTAEALVSALEAMGAVEIRAAPGGNGTEVHCRRPAGTAA
jgi:SAM-dependent methyltransferase